MNIAGFIGKMHGYTQKSTLPKGLVKSYRVVSSCKSLPKLNSC